MIEIRTSRADVNKFEDIVKVTRSCHDKGKRVFLIVPEQLSLQREFAMGKIFPGAVSVLSFGRLSNEIFRTFGGGAKKSPEDVMIACAIYKAVQNCLPRLAYYKNVAQKPGFITKLMSVFSEFETNCMTEKAVLSLSEQDMPLSVRRKYEDLFLIYGEYKNMWQGEYKAPESDVATAAGILEQNTFFDGATVIFDGFYGFTPTQFLMLQQILEQTQDCFFYFTTEKNCELFETVEKEISKIVKLCNDNSFMYVREEVKADSRIKAKGIRWIEKYAFADIGVNADESFCGEGVTVYDAKNLSEELSFIAIKIKNDVLDKKYRYRDIAVLSPDSDNIATVCKTVFEKHGIPVYADVKRTLITKPLAAFVLFAFEIVLEGFEFENIFSFLKTGLTGIPLDDISLLENYVRMWNIRTKGWLEPSWKRSPSGINKTNEQQDAATLEKINLLRERVLTPLTAFSGRLRTAKNSSDMLLAIYFLLETFSVRDNLEDIARDFLDKGQVELYDEYIRIYDLFIDTLDSINETAGADKFSISDFYDLLTVCFSNVSVSNRPSRVDEVVFGNIASVRQENIKCLYIPCLNDGIIPSPFSDSSFITESDKRMFAKHGIPVSMDFASRLDREKFELYVALTSPSDELVLSFSSFEVTGEKKQPSVYLEQITKKMGVKPKTQKDYSKEFFLVSISSASELASRPENTGISEAVYELAGFTPVMGEKEFSPLEKSIVESMYSKHLKLSFSGVEEYVNCPFKFFLGHGLSLTKNESVRFDAANVGTFIHAGLERLLGGEYDLLTIDEKELKKIVSDISEDYYQNELSDCKNRSKRFDYLFSKARYAFENAAVNVVGEIQSSDFAPFDFEIDISDYVPPADLGSGFTLSLKGSIDRVDMAETAEGRFVKIIDYKSGKQKFSLEKIYNGLSMQLPIYAGAVRSKHKDVKFAAMYYLKVGVPEVELTDKKGIDDLKYRSVVNSFYTRDGLFSSDDKVFKMLDRNGEFLKKVKKTSILNDKNICKVVDYANEKVKQIGNEIVSGNIDATPFWQSEKENACKYCDYKTVCGMDGCVERRRRLSALPENFIGEEDE